MNCVNLIGRLAKDPETAFTVNNKEYCKFTLAVKRDNSDDVDYINCVAFNKTAKFISILYFSALLCVIQHFSTLYH